MISAQRFGRIRYRYMRSDYCNPAGLVQALSYHIPELTSRYSQIVIFNRSLDHA